MSDLRRVVFVLIVPMALTACGGDGPSEPGVTPRNIDKISGDLQTEAVGSALPVRPTVRVTGSGGEPIVGAAVEFTVTNGGGSVMSGSQTTNGLGVATSGAWTLGATPGPNSLTATVNSLSTVFTANGVSLAPTEARAGPGDLQQTLQGTAVSIPPAVFVSDAQGTPVSGVSVSFTVRSGGGAITGTQIETDANGLASVGSWVLGPNAGPNELTATVDGLSEVVLRATATDVVPTWNVDLTFSGSASEEAAVMGAIARWQEVIVGDVPDVDFTETPFPQGGCEVPGFGTPEINTILDDMALFVQFATIDGTSGILARARICAVREWGLLPVVGVFQFDRDDVPSFSQALLESTILHEIGHTIGFTDNLWFLFDLVQDKNCAPGGTGSVFQDVHFVGSRARTAFDDIGGSNYTAGQKVPLEDGSFVQSCGSMDSHWRETIFGTELMTPSASATAPMSLATVESLADIGYVVDPASADPFTITLPVTVPSLSAETVWLGDDVMKGGTMLVVGSRGQTRASLDPRMARR